MLTVFTSLACYLGALPGQVRTVVPVPRGDHLPLRARPVLPPLQLTGSTATPTRRYHGVNSSFPPCVCHTGQEGCLHTRRFRTLASPAAPVADMPCGPLSWPSAACPVKGMYPAPHIHEHLRYTNGYGKLRTSSRTT